MLFRSIVGPALELIRGEDDGRAGQGGHAFAIVGPALELVRGEDDGRAGQGGHAFAVVGPALELRRNEDDGGTGNLYPSPAVIASAAKLTLGTQKGQPYEKTDPTMPAAMPPVHDIAIFIGHRGRLCTDGVRSSRLSPPTRL